MSELILPLSNTQARGLAGKRWNYDGQTYFFKDYDPAEPGQPPWRSGAEGKAFPLLDENGQTAAYLKFFTTPSQVRLDRTHWLIAQEMQHWAPQLGAAPSAWVDSRESGLPGGVEFDFTGCLAAAAQGETWLELKYRLCENNIAFDRALRWQCVLDLVTALGVLENAGLVHGDLSPGNIVVNVRPPLEGPALAVVDFDAFVAETGGRRLALSVAQGGTYGTQGYCPPDLVARAQAGDLSVAPYSDRHSRDLLLLELLLAGPEFPPEMPPSKWPLEKLDLHYRALLATLPADEAAAIQHLQPQTAFSLPEQERPSSAELARMLALPLPTRQLRETPITPPKPVVIRRPTPQPARTPPPPAPAPLPPPAPPRRARSAWIFLAIVLLLATAGYGYWNIYLPAAAKAEARAKSNAEAKSAKEKADAEAKVEARAKAKMELEAKAKAEAEAKGLAAVLAGSPSGERWTNTLGMVFVGVPGAPAFSIWDTRVQDYQAFAAATACVWEPPSYSRKLTHPAVNVSWNDAEAFCQWLTAKESGDGKLAADQSYRLPTDDEWSVAVGLENEPGSWPKDKNGKIKGVYPWGTQWPPSRGAGNYDSKLRVDDFDYTSPVGSFHANKIGLFDMGGNVWQWCSDEYFPGSTSRVLRGGSWNDNEDLSSSYRNNRPPVIRNGSIGFRCVLAKGPRQAATNGPAPLAQPATTPLAIDVQATVPAPVGLPLGQYWTNTLGMVFAGVPGAPAFSIWETRAQDYQMFAKDGGHWWRGNYAHWVQVPSHPAVYINWDDAQAFCQWLTARERREGKLSAVQNYRLPTDAEWSMAVGLPIETGTTPSEKSSKIRNVYPWGKQWPPPKDAGNYQWSSFKGTSPVGSFAANQFGLFDLGGNVWEWCEDWFGTSQQSRVLRGASWDDRISGDLLSSYRSCREPHLHSFEMSQRIGFRCVLVLGGSTASWNATAPSAAKSVQSRD